MEYYWCNVCGKAHEGSCEEAQAIESKTKAEGLNRRQLLWSDIINVRDLISVIESDILFPNKDVCNILKVLKRLEEK